MGNFKDMLTDRAANKVISDFVAERIRERVKDPATAEKLIPKDHGFGTRRVPQETFYYEVYNQPNVELVSMLETPIERITPKGLETNDRSFEFDIIIYATGFDAITGSFDRIDIQGADGIKLKDKWKGGPTTYLGMMVKDFPNMFMVVGPHTALGNIPRSIEHIAEWVAGAINHMHQNGITFADPTQSGVDEWTDYVAEVGEGLLSNEIDSWMTGINLNVEGKQTRILARYSGSAVEYRRRCDKIAEDGYTDVTFTSRGGVMANANPNH
jgi:cation diffusion facilitator CzcD-associated flavoprotein CzcO